MSPFPVWSQQGLYAHTHTDHGPPYTQTQYMCAPYPPQPAHTPYRAHMHPELCPVHGQPSAFLACPQSGTWGRRAGADSPGTSCGAGAPTEAGSAQSVLPPETGCDLSPVPANWSDRPTAHGGRDGVKSEPEVAPRPLSWSGAQAWGPQCPLPAREGEELAKTQSPGRVGLAAEQITPCYLPCPRPLAFFISLIPLLTLGPTKAGLAHMALRPGRSSARRTAGAQGDVGSEWVSGQLSRGAGGGRQPGSLWRRSPGLDPDLLGAAQPALPGLSFPLCS